MYRRNRSTFYCFSPPVMIATCIIELGLLVYNLWRYRWTPFTRLVALMLFFLAIFQLAEFQVCTGTSGLLQWSHLGYVAITMLPPLGIHALALLRNKPRHPIIYAAYATGAAFVAYFALTASSLNGHECLGNYVIFQVNPDITWLYAIYYYGWVIAGMFLGWQWGKQSRKKATRQALYGFAAGYAAFLIPTTTVNLLDRSTTNGIPSIMCGFAVLFAVIVSLWVMPRVAKRR